MLENLKQHRGPLGTYCGKFFFNSSKPFRRYGFPPCTQLFESRTVVKIQTNPESDSFFTRVGRFSISTENRPANQEASFHEQTNQRHSRFTDSILKSETIYTKYKCLNALICNILGHFASSDVENTSTGKLFRVQRNFFLFGFFDTPPY